MAFAAMIAMAVPVRMELGGIAVLVGMIFVFFSMNGIIAASATAAALDDVPHIAGSASALIGGLQYGSGIISSLLLAVFGTGTPWTMTWIMLVFTGALFFIVLGKARRKWRSAFSGPDEQAMVAEDRPSFPFRMLVPSPDSPFFSPVSWRRRPPRAPVRANRATPAESGDGEWGWLPAGPGV